MAAKQEQVDGLTMPRSRACSLLQASNSLSFKKLSVHSRLAFWELESRRMGRLDQLAMKIKFSKNRVTSLRQIVLSEANVPSPKLAT